MAEDPKDPKGTPPAVTKEPVVAELPPLDKVELPDVGDTVMFMDRDDLAIPAIVCFVHRPMNLQPEEKDMKRLNLAAFSENGMHFKKRTIPYSNKKSGGTWHHKPKKSSEAAK